MRIVDLFGTDAPVISFEFFPPKTEEGVETLYKTVQELRPCRPSFVSVTYGAGGSTRDRTLELVARIQRDLGITTMAHLTCVGSTKAEIKDTLERLHASGIRNVLALRGDPPKGESDFRPTEGGFAYATEGGGFIRELGRDFCSGSSTSGHGEKSDILQHCRISHRPFGRKLAEYHTPAHTWSGGASRRGSSRGVGGKSARSLSPARKRAPS